MNFSTDQLRMLGFIAAITIFGIFVLWAGVTAKSTKTNAQIEQE